MIAQQIEKDIAMAFVDAMRKLNAKNWQEALEIEFKTPTNIHKWELVCLPEDHKATTTWWALEIKLDGQENFLRLKAHLVTQTF